MATPSRLHFQHWRAGLTLGGGIGYLTRRCGLTIRQSPRGGYGSGRWPLVTANSEENPDLFWAVHRRWRKLRSGHFLRVSAPPDDPRRPTRTPSQRGSFLSQGPRECPSFGKGRSL